MSMLRAYSLNGKVVLEISCDLMLETRLGMAGFANKTKFVLSALGEKRQWGPIK
jgi:hypothetical protein